ncbi:MAG TPA: hypothetical protein PLS49_04315 [Candidatus Woesebacteria bacterium]|nr:hypothetical protein [Candidatus Woesebacteria bacterium]
MDLQSIFYVIAIAVMLSWLIVLILLGMVLWSIYDVVKNAPKKIEETVSNIIQTNKSSLLGMVGVTIGPFLFSQIKNWFRK